MKKIKYSVNDRFWGELMLDGEMSKGEVYNGWERSRIYVIEFFSVECKKFSKGSSDEPMGSIDYEIDYREENIVYTLSYYVFNFVSDEFCCEMEERHNIGKYYKQVTQDELDHLLKVKHFIKL